MSRLPTGLGHHWPPLTAAATLLVVWEGWVRLAKVDPSLLPPPTSVLRAASNDRSALAEAGWQTLQASGLGFTLALLVAALIAIAIDRWEAVRRAVEPLLVASQALPIIALAPLLVIWADFDRAKVLVVALYAVFPIAVGAVRGLQTADPEAIAMVQAMGAGRLRTLWSVRLPSAADSIFTGLRLAATYTVPAALVGEYVGGQGLGQYMQQAGNGGTTDLVFAGVFTSVFLTVAIYALVAIVERSAAPWLRG